MLSSEDAAGRDGPGSTGVCTLGVSHLEPINLRSPASGAYKPEVSHICSLHTWALNT